MSNDNKFDDYFPSPVVGIAPSSTIKATREGKVSMWILGWSSQVETGLRIGDYKGHKFEQVNYCN